MVEMDNKLSVYFYVLIEVYEKMFTLNDNSAGSNNKTFCAGICCKC
jgi:hypothetical protein